MEEEFDRTLSMELKLKSGVLRSWAAGDAKAIARYANNRKIWANLRDAFPHPYALADAEGFLNMVAQEKPEMTFAIATEAEAIGCIGLRRGVDVHRKTAELGFWLGEPFWGGGIMTEAVREFVRWGFEELDLNRIQAESFEGNAASARVLEKAGFVREGRMRANVLKDGKVMDSLLYARLSQPTA